MRQPLFSEAIGESAQAFATENSAASTEDFARVFDAEEVCDFAEVRRVVYDEICALALFNRAQFTPAPQTVRGVDGRCGQTLRRRHLHVRGG